MWCSALSALAILLVVCSLSSLHVNTYTKQIFSASSQQITGQIPSSFNLLLTSSTKKMMMLGFLFPRAPWRWWRDTTHTSNSTATQCLILQRSPAAVEDYSYYGGSLCTTEVLLQHHCNITFTIPIVLHVAPIMTLCIGCVNTV